MWYLRVVNFSILRLSVAAPTPSGLRGGNFLSVAGFQHLLGGFAKAPLAGGEPCQSLIEGPCAKLGPEGVCEVQLRIGRLPQ